MSAPTPVPGERETKLGWLFSLALCVVAGVAANCLYQLDAVSGTGSSAKIIAVALVAASLIYCFIKEDGALAFVGFLFSALGFGFGAVLTGTLHITPVIVLVMAGIVGAGLVTCLVRLHR